MLKYKYIKNVVFLQQGRQSKNAWAVPNDTSNTIEVRYVLSQEDIRGIKGYADFSKKVLDALEDIRTDIRNVKVRVTRMEIGMKNNQHTKSTLRNRRSLEFVRNTLDKI